MAVMDDSARPHARFRSFVRFAVAILLSTGLAWLGVSAWQAVHGGRDADIHRFWIAAQYVVHDVNPYPVASAALEHACGRMGERPEMPKLYAIPRLTPAEAAGDPRVPANAMPILAAQGPPEATYPPGAQLVLALILGWMPEAYLHSIWLMVNLALLAGLAWLLWRQESGTAAACGMLSPPMRIPNSTGSRRWAAKAWHPAFAATLALLLIWPPSQKAVVAGQLCLLATVCVLLGLRWLDRREFAAGALLSLALIKPSLALPFLIVPLVRGRWRALAVVVLSQAALLLVASYRCGCAPWTLLRQWLEVASYMSQAGQFTLRDLVMALHLAGTPAGLALEGGFVLSALAWCWWNRRAPDDLLIDLLCFVSILWTYHSVYDFVIVLAPLTRRLGATASEAERPLLAAAFLPALATFVCLGLATFPLIYADESLIVCRLVRHAARLALVMWVVGLAVQTWRAARARGAVERAGPGLTLAGGGQAA